MLQGTDLRGRTMIWLGIELGAKDLSAIHVGQISAKAYDLRRREVGQTLFVTRNGVPLVTPTSNSVTLWWDKLRTKVGEKKETLDGFYTLRHLGATEFGRGPAVPSTTSSVGSGTRPAAIWPTSTCGPSAPNSGE